ncbi:endo-1,4-beta-xylanase [Streptosporangiaceae bacterium NEAU-GS5]|nr:endo-1,4-beta-xylanase [Streptosporangiaceae bacterium NEAU-GS5]
MAALLTALIGLTLTLVVPAAPAGATPAPGTLGALAAARGKYLGSSTDNGELTDMAYTSILTSEFGQLMPSDAMMWDATQQGRNLFNFVAGDQIANFAVANTMTLRGHTLVWHSHLPAWVQSIPAADLLGVMREHISQIVTHFAGKANQWAVVNEPLNDDGTRRQTVFQRNIGDSYIAEAFRAAREAAGPGVKLYINEFGAEGVNAKSDALFTLVQSLVQQGVPIDGVGFEGHMVLGQIPTTVQQNLQRFANLGLDVAFTELDVRMALPRTTAKDTQQADDFRQLINVCLAVARCAGWTLAEFTDKYSLIPITFSGQGAATPWDQNLAKKPAYNAIRDALSIGPIQPNPPGNPGATSTCTSITITWTASTTSGVTYDVMRATGTSGGTFTVIGNTAGTSFTDTNVVTNTVYRYQIRARDAAGNVSVPTNPIITALNCEGEPPTPPTNLTATNITSSSVTLTWGPATDNVGVVGYDVYRAPGASGGAFTLIGSTTQLTFTNGGLTPNTTYRFQVRARDASGLMSQPSNTVTVTTAPNTVACTATPTVQTQWSTGYVINPLTVTNTSSTTITSWTVTFTLPPGHVLTGSWNVQASTSGQIVTFHSLSFNGTIPPGGSVNGMGFQASRPAGNTALPTSYTCTTP